MKVNEFISRFLMGGYAGIELSAGIVFFCILSVSVLALYIFGVYKRINRNAVYNRNFNLSLIALAMITMAIILTIQSNIVISLGMVGALSIIRFRTAIKDPLDLVFMFWAIGIGIICGAGFILVAVIISLALSIVLLLAGNIAAPKKAMVLVVNADDYRVEEALVDTVGKHCKYICVKAKNVTRASLNIAIEIQCKSDRELIGELMQMDHILSASLVESTGDVTV